MKKTNILTLMLILTVSVAFGQYNLNYPDIKIGNKPDGGKIVLNGSNLQMPRISDGSATDSVLTIVNGVIKKVPRSQFSGGGSAGVTSFNNRNGNVVSQSSDYSSFYYPLSSNPAGYLTSAPTYTAGYGMSLVGQQFRVDTTLITTNKRFNIVNDIPNIYNKTILGLFGDSQTEGVNLGNPTIYNWVNPTPYAIGPGAPAYTHLYPQFIWGNQLKDLINADTVINRGVGGSRISWGGGLGLRSYAEEMSHFNRTGAFSYSWKGIAATMMGWNNSGQQIKTEIQKREYYNQMKISQMAVFAKLLVDDWAGISFLGWDRNSTPYVNNWVTTGENGEDVTQNTDKTSFMPFSMNTSADVNRYYTKLRGGQFLQFTISNKRSVALFYETGNAGAGTVGGNFDVYVNDVKVGNYSTKYKEPGYEEDFFPGVVWLDNIPETATIKITSNGANNEIVRFLAYGYVFKGSDSFVDKRIILGGTTSGNNAFRSQENISRLSEATKEAVGLFKDYPVYFVDVAKSWKYETAQQIDDISHITAIGNDAIAKAFINNISKPFATYSPNMIRVGGDGNYGAITPNFDLGTSAYTDTTYNTLQRVTANNGTTTLNANFNGAKIGKWFTSGDFARFGNSLWDSNNGAYGFLQSNDGGVFVQGTNVTIGSTAGSVHIKNFEGGSDKNVIAGSNGELKSLPLDNLQSVANRGNGINNGINFNANGSSYVLGNYSGGLTIDESGVANRLFLQVGTGNFGFGNTNPSEKIDVSGNIKASSLAGTGDSPIGVDANGILKRITSSSYTLPIASSTVLGGIKVGSGLSIDGDGVLSSTGSAGSYMDLTTNQTAAGNKTFTGFTTLNSASTNAFTLRNNGSISTPAGGDVNVIASAGKTVIASSTGTIGLITPTSSTLRNFTFPDKSGTVAVAEDYPIVQSGTGSLTIPSGSNITRVGAHTLTLTSSATTNATFPTGTYTLANASNVARQARYTASGNGSSTAIVVPHALSGVTTTSSVIVTPNNSASAGITYVTVDATNVTINYSVAPPSGTTNLLYSISIK